MSGIDEEETDLLYIDAVASTAENEACSHSFCEAASLGYG